MASKVDICKLALTYLGANRIIDLEDDTEEAIKINIMYDMARRAEIESFPWNFATKRATLALLTAVPDHKYSAYFQLPPDFIRGIRLNDTEAEYRIEGNKLATNEGAAELEYLADIEDTTMFPALFVESLAAKLAKDLSISITDKEGIWDRFEKDYKIKHAMASFSDSQQGTPRPLMDNSWITARFKA